jgi:hypothetical protein
MEAFSHIICDYQLSCTHSRSRESTFGAELPGLKVADRLNAAGDCFDVSQKPVANVLFSQSSETVGGRAAPIKDSAPSFMSPMLGCG